MCFSRLSISVAVTSVFVFASCMPVILPLKSTKGTPGSLVCEPVVPAVAGALPAAEAGAMGVRNCVSVSGFATLVAEGGMVLAVALEESSMAMGAGLPSVLARSTSTKGKGLLLWNEKRVAFVPATVTRACGPVGSLQIPAVVQLKVSRVDRFGWVPVN